MLITKAKCATLDLVRHLELFTHLSLVSLCLITGIILVGYWLYFKVIVVIVRVSTCANILHILFPYDEKVTYYCAHND